MNAKGIAIVLGLLVAVTGLILGVAGTSATVGKTNIFSGASMGSDSLGCGSVFDPKAYDEMVIGIDLDRATVVEKCATAVSSRAPFVWVMLGLGVLIAVGGMMYRPTKAPIRDARPEN